MTREIKLALILGSALVLVVGVLISDHMSGARLAKLERVAPDSVGAPIASQTPRIEIHAAPAVPLRDEPAPPAPTHLALAETPGASHTQGVGIEPQTTYEPLVIDMGTALAFDAGATDPTMALNEAPLDSVAAFKAWAEQQGVRLVDAPAAASVDRRPGPNGNGANGARPQQTTGATTTQRPAPAEPDREHAVVRGDSLWKIAERYYGDGALHTQLSRYNRDRLGANGELLAGSRLRIPSRAALTGQAEPAPSARPTTGAPAPSPAARPAARTETYTVQRGDTLGEIAQRTLGTSRRWREIVELNKDVIKDPDVVPVGTVLKLPAR